MNTTPKDFFVHIGATLALFASVGALLNLVFSVINYYLPDQLANYFYANSVAWPISILFVLIPLLYVLEWQIGRDVILIPEKVEIWIRKWRIYLTLFLAGALIVGDLIVLINTFLNGEITSRLVYKIIVVLLVSVVVFTHYLYERAPQPQNLVRKITAWVGIILVFVSVFVGFLATGSPTKQRNLRFDSQRINDLTNIQWQIISYWQINAKLPVVLNDLNNDISNYSVPKDPSTNSDYSYSPKGETSFQLCADFALSSKDQKNTGFYDTKPLGLNDSWSHDSGQACFDRTIDPKQYQVLSKPVIK